MPEITQTSFGGRADLEALIHFVSTNTLLRAPQKAQWHVGDVTWMLSEFDTAGPIDSFHLWYEGARLVGVAWFESATHVRIDVLAGIDYHEALLDEILRFCEAKHSPGPRADEPRALFTIAFDDDTRRIDALREHRYVPAGRQAVHLRRDLRELPVPKGTLPSGMEFRDGRDIDIAERLEVHVDAWTHLAHLGIPEAESTFSAKRYRRITGSSNYTAELDVVVATPEGQYAASALCWLDPDSGIGLTEPVGTRFAFRGRGLSRAINLECLRRLREHGMHTAVIQTAHFNAAARATYVSCGYELVDRDSWFVKPVF